MFVKQLTLSVLGFSILLFWYLTYNVNCFLLIIPMILSILLAKSTYEYMIVKKVCSANCFFKRDSLLYSLLTKKVFIILISMLSGMILSFILLLNVLNFTILDWTLLFIDILLIIWLYNKFDKINFLNSNIKFSVLKHSVSIVSAILLSTVFLIANLYQKPPHYIQDSLSSTVHEASKQVHSNCKYIDSVTGISIEISSVKWWIILKMSDNIKNTYLKATMWILYLLGNYLMLFAFARLISEMIYLTPKENTKDE